MRFVLYALRWQASTPILIGVLALVEWLLPGNRWAGPVLANLAGAALFFRVDALILKRRAPSETCDGGDTGGGTLRQDAHQHVR